MSSAKKPTAVGAAAAALDAAPVAHHDKLPAVDSLTDEALRRFDAFHFTFCTDTRDTVDLQTVQDFVARDPSVAEYFFLIERSDAVSYFCSLPQEAVLPPYHHVAAEVRQQQAQLSDVEAPLTSHQSFLVAACIHQKLASFAVTREKRRLAEIDAARSAHEELVEKYLDDGLSAHEAEKAALAEEEAAKAAETATGGDDDEEDPETLRVKAFVCLRGFPQTATDVVSLSKVGIQLNAALCINSDAKFGIRKDAADAKAQSAQPPAGSKGGKQPAPAPDAKKADPKKSAPGKKGDDVTINVAESLIISIRRELGKMAPFASHTLGDTALWDFVAPTVPSTAGLASNPTDEAGSLRHMELAEPESQLFGKISSRVVDMERLHHQFHAWSHLRKTRSVPPLVLAAAQAREEAEAAAAAVAREKAAEAAAKAPGGKKAPNPPPKGSKGGEAPTEVPKDESLVPLPQPPLPPLPTSMADIGRDASIPSLGLSDDADVPMAVGACIDAACTLTANGDTLHANATAVLSDPSRVSAQEVLERAVRSAKEDVSDYIDYVLSVMDGTTRTVCDGIIARRQACREEADDGRRAVGSGYLPPTVSTVSTALPDAALAPHGQCDSAASITESDTALREAIAAAFGAEMSSADVAELVDQLGVVGRLHTKAELHAAIRGHPMFRSMDAAVTDVRLVRSTSGMASSALVTNAPVGSAIRDRHRMLSSWTALHGCASWPQYLDWCDTVARELLHYEPPPRDADDIQDEALDDAKGEDEEEEEEEEEIEDEDGNLVTIRKKREKKIILYDPEYVNVAAERREALRRRQRLELLSRLTASSSGPHGTADEWLLAKNHAAHVVHEEVDMLYPDDGCGIVVRSTRGSTHTVSATVHAAGAPVSFGFRTTVPTVPRQAGAIPSSTDVSSGVRSVVVIDDVVATITTRLLKEPSTTVDPTVTASSDPPPTPPLPQGQAGAGSQSPPKNSPRTSGSKPPQDPSRQADVGNSRPASSASVRRAAAAVPHAVEMGPVVDMSLSNFNGVTVAIRGDGDALHLLPNATIPLASIQERPVVYVYRPESQSVVATPLLRELRRSVLTTGVVRITYATVAPSPSTHLSPQSTVSAHVSSPSQASAGAVAPLESSLKSGEAEAVVYLYPDGGSLSVFENAALLTTAAGARLGRDIASLDGATSTVSLGEVRAVSSFDEQRHCAVHVREDGTTTRYTFTDGTTYISFFDGSVMERHAHTNGGVTNAAGFTWVLPRPYPLVSVRPSGEVLVHDDVRQRLTLSWQRGHYLNVSSASYGLTAHIPLASHPHLMHVFTTSSATAAPLPMPSRHHTHRDQKEEHEGRTLAYVIDMLYGGLRVEDQTHAFHVTAFGDCRARLLSEEHAPPPTDFTVKHTLEVFAPQLQFPSIAFHALLQQRCGSSNQSNGSQTEIAPPAAVPLLLPVEPIQLRLHVPELTETQLSHLRTSWSAASHASGLHESPVTSAEGHRLRAVTEEVLSHLRISHSSHRNSAAASRYSYGCWSNGLVVRDDVEGHGVCFTTPQQRRQIARHILATADLIRSCTRLTSNGVVELLLQPKCPHRTKVEGVLHGVLLARNEAQHPTWIKDPRSVHEAIQVLVGASRNAASLRSTAGESESATFPSILRLVSGWGGDRGGITMPSVYTMETLTDALHRSLPPAAREQHGALFDAHRSTRFQGHYPLVPNRAAIPSAHTALRHEVRRIDGSARNYWSGQVVDLKQSQSQPMAVQRDSSKPSQVAPQTAPAARTDAQAIGVSQQPVAVIGSSAPHRQLHTNPVPGSPVQTHTVSSSLVSRRFVQHRLVATPTVLDFGTVMQSFRYTLTLQLTNVSTQSSRFRVTIPQDATWLSVEQPRVPIAAGMSVPVVWEVSGHQTPGAVEVLCTVLYEGGGTLTVPVRIATRSLDERPVSQQARGVRLVGPAPMVYIPNSSGGSLPLREADDDDE